MKKVLKVMLKVILWLIPCLVAVVGWLAWIVRLFSDVGCYIKCYGYEYLDEPNAEKSRMSYKDYKSLDKSKQDAVWKKALSDVNYMRNMGAKWWIEYFNK